MERVEHGVQRDAFTAVTAFRTELYASLLARGDALFELCDALLCTDGPVQTLVDLALAPEHRRGHGALYAGLNQGRIDVARLRRALAGVPLPRAVDGRLVLAVDVSPWLRPDADTCSDRSFCHTFGRGLGKHQMVPGWPYSIVAALEPGRTSWTALLDAIRLEPGADLAAVTASQVREVVERLIAAGQWQRGQPDVLVVLDAGYDAPRIAHLLADMPIEVLGRLRSDRVMRKPVPVPWICPPQGGRPPKHGGEFVFGDPDTWGEETAVTATATERYGTAIAQAWDRLHPRLTRRAAWGNHEGPLPIIEGTVIRLTVAQLPSGGVNKPVWLWWSGTGAAPGDVDRCWQAFLRRFDVEHTFRLLKQTLGWTRPKLRDSTAADRWTWLVLAAHAQLRLARPLATDLRRPWERPAEPNKLTPARVRRGFRNLHARTGTPARAPKPTRPGPGRPLGSKNQRPATRYDVGRVLATGEPYTRPAHHQIGTKPRRVAGERPT
ncbi:transposase [Streptomyces sp. NBC_01214]|uniref:NF041680 family putative transposase n=1 Tax=Streptomyces sp. NBC_01214 TaxID=2903777 RepID=UPI00224ED059|nr:NF041680 family putative transposase [Streptomyces sp. NBC_01214]MCX4808720.1 transposase [Streptomyces sp. NBC_01214]